MSKKVVCLIPAYNEEKRIGAVLSVVKKCELVDEIFVIDDGSVDKTAEVAAKNCVSVLRLEKTGERAMLFFTVLKIHKVI